MSERPLTTFIIIMLAVFGAAVGGASIGYNMGRHDAERRSVYVLCNTARQEISGVSERACGDEQDRTHTEFLCSNNAPIPTVRCWVESK